MKAAGKHKDRCATDTSQAFISRKSPFWRLRKKRLNVRPKAALR
jgi:hypothetical protein